jgi:hypothetical protein
LALVHCINGYGRFYRQQYPKNFTKNIPLFFFGNNFFWQSWLRIKTAGLTSLDIIIYVLCSPIFLNVYFEHLVYSAALAVIVGMIFSRTTGRDPSWIIIAVAFVPDISALLFRIQKAFSIVHPAQLPPTITHNSMHTIFALVIFSLLIAVILTPFRFRFSDTLICSALGIAAHFFEDALVYNSGYTIFWPVTSQKFGIGIMKETVNVFGIANSTVLGLGIILLAAALLVRTQVEGPEWWRIFLRGGREEKLATE